MSGPLPKAYSLAMPAKMRTRRAASRTHCAPSASRCGSTAASCAAADPDNINLATSLSHAQGIAGDTKGAGETLERILATVKPGLSLRQQIYRQSNAAIVYGWIGHKDKAVDLIESMMTIPTAAFNSVHGMKDDIDFFPLRGFPRWEALLKNPEFNKPFNY